VPDRPWAEIDDYDTDGLGGGWENRARPDSLADRLRRLAPGHPSADLADGRIGNDIYPDEVDGCDDQLSDLDLGDADFDYLAPDDLETDGGGAGADSAADMAPRSQRSRLADIPQAGGNSDTAREPYRPWFMADATSEPWFAAKQAD
jgi:hypothetical protein